MSVLDIAVLLVGLAMTGLLVLCFLGPKRVRPAEVKGGLQAGVVTVAVVGAIHDVVRR